MKIVFLGVSSDDKKFIILCLAKIMSYLGKVVIYSTTPYGYSKDKEYDYCGIEIHQINLNEAIDPLIREENINFIDIEELIPIGGDFKAVVMCEITRRSLEHTAEFVKKFAWSNQANDILLVYLNILEYCKINEKYLNLFWDRELPSFTHISHKCMFVFEEINKIIMVESQFNERLPLKSLTKSFKLSLMEIVKALLDLEQKESRKILKKTERMK
ncbi:MAG: hypothetical protein GX957_13095 [Clostridiaceae bacterium]|nr:hypothetical protein [Clostridiaceae bacterium]